MDYTSPLPSSVKHCKPKYPKYVSAATPHHLWEKRHCVFHLAHVIPYNIERRRSIICAAAHHQKVSIVIHLYLEQSSLLEQIKSNQINQNYMRLESTCQLLKQTQVWLSLVFPISRLL